MLAIAGGILLAILIVVCSAALASEIAALAVLGLLALIAAPFAGVFVDTLQKWADATPLAIQHGVETFFTCAGVFAFFLYPAGWLAYGIYRVFRPKAKPSPDLTDDELRKWWADNNKRWY